MIVVVELSLELLRLLVALDEELLSALTVDGQEVWVEVSRVTRFRLVTP